MKRSTILFSIPHGQHARDLLRSRVLKNLLDKTSHEFVILTPAVSEFKAEFAGLTSRVHIESLQALDHNPRAGKLKRIRDSAMVAPSRNVLSVWRQVERRLFPISEERYLPIFERYKPQLVVTPTPGQKFADIPVLWCARRLGIPTLAVVASWDNLVTKGSFGVSPDYLAVWNPMMVDEAIRYHHFPRERIFITGAPQFDLYHAEADHRLDRKATLDAYRLDPKRKTIFVTTAPRRATIDHTFILDILLEAQQAKAFSFPTQILCRLHPEDEWDRFKKYEGRSHFAFDFPSPPHPQLYWNPPWEEQQHVADLLHACDINVNVASTLTLEACLANRPVVNVSFSPMEPEEFRYRIVKNHYGKHYKHVLDRHGVYLAQNPDDLVQAINRYLEQPELHNEGRQKIADDFTGQMRGKSCATLASLIDRLAGQVLEVRSN